MAKTGVIYGINGPVVSLAGDPGFQMNEMVYVGKENLVGEVIGLTSEKTTIQVYEETSGLKPGEVVTGTGKKVLKVVERVIRNEIKRASGDPPFCLGIFHQPKRPVEHKQHR